MMTTFISLTITVLTGFLTAMSYATGCLTGAESDLLKEGTRADIA